MSNLKKKVKKKRRTEKEKYPNYERVRLKWLDAGYLCTMISHKPNAGNVLILCTA